ncbi:oligosaccharide flippase family protein [Bacillus sp. CGMCC 1.16607]|uniref:oligosaccharide flippase family protein n=1 Tax=Bacillus sp. CGMCC 1.16607 TaxID=3351842 RepID=UPI00363F1460
MKLFIRATFLLAITAFIGECVEFIINMILAKELGEKGLGLYMSILPTIFLVVVLASLELPISVSKLIAEKDEKYHRNILSQVTKFAILSTISFLVIAMIVLPIVPVFDAYHPYVKWLVLILIPIASFSSIARGFFMGTHAMGKIAVSNFLRRALQLLLLVFVFQLLEFSTDMAIILALCALVASEIGVFGYLIIEYLIKLRTLNGKSRSQLSSKSVRESLLSVSVPTTGLRIFHSLTHAVQPFLIKAALMKAGLSADIAMEQFGLVAGVALTIGFFPAFIAHSLLIVLIPTVSKAYAQKDFTLLQSLLRKVMHFTFIYGVPAVLAFYFFSKPLTRLFFDSDDATIYLQMLWPYFLFHFFVIPMQAYLIGLGLVKDAFYHQIWTTIISFSMMFVFGSLPQLQMDGIIVGMNMGAVLLMLLHYVTICKKIGVSFFVMNPIKEG